MSHDAITDLLPAYLTGTLSAPEEWRVRSHLESCADCRLALQAWEGIFITEQAARAAVQPRRDILAGAWATIDATASMAPRTPPMRWRQTAQVVARQVRLLRPAVWVASACAIALATYVAAQQPGHDAGALLLAFALPLIAATGVGFISDPEADPLLEVARSTPTSPRLIFLSRWGLLYGFDMLLSFGGTIALAGQSHQGLWSIAMLWVGPMALLSALSALLALLFGPFVAAAGALVLWVGRALHLAAGGSVQLAPVPLGSTNLPMLLLTAAIVCLALVVAERRERFDPTK